MASERDILRALDLLTVAPAPTTREARSFTRGEGERVDNLRRVVDSENVVAVGISEKESEGRLTGRLALTFYVARKIPLAELSANEAVPPALPEALSGPRAIPTDVKAIGRIRLEVNAVHNPVQPGNSVAHVNVEAGTLGAFVRKGGRLMMLSNSHVLAASGLAAKGDAILYPGRHDGGAEPDDLVARLADFVKFETGGDFVNRVDCAIAEPVKGRLGQIKKEIKWLGLPAGRVRARRGMNVTKVGRTSGRTTGRVLDVNFRTVVFYPGVGEIGFIDQVLCTRYTQAGDSGALVMDKETGKAVGLHFSGSEPEGDATGSSIFNPIGEVLKALGVSLVVRRRAER
jgi:hypothetical protein